MTKLGESPDETFKRWSTSNKNSLARYRQRPVGMLKVFTAGMPRRVHELRLPYELTTLRCSPSGARGHVPPPMDAPAGGGGGQR